MGAGGQPVTTLPYVYWRVFLMRKLRWIATGGAVILIVGGVCSLFLLEDSSTPAHASVALNEGAVPAEYVADVQRAGSLCPEITPPIIAAQIQQESGWQTHAESTAAAKGISQFIDSTWASMGKDGDGDGIADVTNPHDAIYSQGRYMCDNVTNLKPLIESGEVTGDLPSLALAAYNAGLGAVQQYGGIPPFDETQNYVTTIMANVATYTADDGSLNTSTATSGDKGPAIDFARQIAADDTHQYVLGGEGPHYDCSGLTQAAYAQIGIELPHKAHEQAQNGTTIDGLDHAQPGDLLFWGDPTYYWHVAIYAGDGIMISADSPEKGINEEAIWGTPTLIKRY